MKTNPNLRRLRAGSALVYTSMLMMAITTVVVTTAQLNGAASQKAERQIEAVLTDESEMGVVAAVQAKCNLNSIVLPQTWNFTLNGQTQSATVSDNSATMDRTYSVVTTVTGSTTRTFNRVVAGRQTSNPFYFALWMDRATDLSARRVITSNPGHIYSRGNLTLRSTSSIDGEVVADGSITTNGATITKNVIAQARTRNLPTTTISDYTTVSASLGNATISDILFFPVASHSFFPLRCYNHLDVSGLITGKGTIYCNGNVKVANNLAYVSAAGRVVFIVEGDLDVDKSVTRLDGMWFVKGRVRIKGAGPTLENVRGCIVAGGDFELERDLNITGDASFWLARNEGVRHRLPGFWPTPAAGLLR